MSAVGPVSTLGLGPGFVAASDTLGAQVTTVSCMELFRGPIDQHTHSLLCWGLHTHAGQDRRLFLSVAWPPLLHVVGTLCHTDRRQPANHCSCDADPGFAHCIFCSCICTGFLLIAWPCCCVIVCTLFSQEEPASAIATLLHRLSVCLFSVVPGWPGCPPFQREVTCSMPAARIGVICPFVTSVRSVAVLGWVFWCVSCCDSLVLPYRRRRFLRVYLHSCRECTGRLQECALHYAKALARALVVSSSIT